MKIVSVVGARPNFIKIAPFCHAINAYNKTADKQIEHLLVHTGQHYDDKMSKAFFEALNIPPADINLGIGSGSHAEQVGRTMIEFEKVIWEHKPDWVIVVGDVNAVCACTITAKKEHIKCAHIEAGLRSHDMNMPEEINRLVADRLADMLFTPDLMANENLRKEGIPEEKVKFVGNIMIDTLEAQKEIASKLDLNNILGKNLLDETSKINYTLEDNKYAVITMHRPSNVDKKEILEPIVNFLTKEVATESPLIWPIHPRTAKQLKIFGLWRQVVECPKLILLSPLGYHELLRLNIGASLMLTDSGGLQEECCVLGTPCLTLRWNTERPITLQENGGASILVGNNIEQIREEYRQSLTSSRTPQRPELWDGQTAKRIIAVLTEKCLIS